MKIPISPLTLGTVQLGMDYGIANAKGRPADSIGREILNIALRNGITTLDTSRHYGDSERVIGDFLVANTTVPLATVVSKFRWSPNALADRKLAKREAVASVRESLRELRIGVLPMLLYHKSADEPIDRVMRILPDILKELQDDGLIQYGGISLYYPHEVNTVVEEAVVSAVQIPISIFDQRTLQDGGLQELEERGRIVFARSVFLQGLLFLTAAQLPGNLRDAQPFIERFNGIASHAGLDKAQLAFSYVRGLSGVSSIIFGAEHPDQVEQNVAWLNAPLLQDGVRKEIDLVLRDIPVRIITPGLW